jgi:hypothetical protein
MCRAWFLEEESELRTLADFLAGKNPRADELACLTAHAPQMDKDAPRDKEVLMSISCVTDSERFLRLRMISAAVYLSVCVK